MTDPIPTLRFIPFRKRDIVAMCPGRGDPDARSQQEFRDFSRQLESIIHFVFYKLLETLKDNYVASDPDAITRLPNAMDHGTTGDGSRLAELLSELLDRQTTRSVRMPTSNRRCMNRHISGSDCKSIFVISGKCRCSIAVSSSARKSCELGGD